MLTNQETMKQAVFNKHILLITTATIFSILGVALLFNSSAATGDNTLEPENGTITAPATLVTDTNASNGKAVKFASAGTVACTSSTQHVPDGPDGMGGCWPGPSNTGVPIGTQLSNYTGSCNITTSNTVIDKKTINCNLYIQAKNVNITNSNITGAIIIDSSYCSQYSFTVTDSTIFTPDINLRALMSCSYTATRVNASGGQSMAWCDTCTIQDSYLHNPLEDPAGAAANHGAHNSTVRVSKNAYLKHNTLWCEVKEYPQPNGQDTSGCSANQTAYSHDGAPPYNSTIEANLYMPTTGGYCAYGGSTTGDLAAVHDVVFKNNIFKRGTRPSDHGLFVCGYYGTATSFDANRPGNQWINNKYDDGTIVNPQ